MKIILAILLCITGSQCGVLKDDLNISGSTVQTVQVIDFYYDGKQTLANIFDVTNNKDDPATYIETTKLQPGLHSWHITFVTRFQSRNSTEKNYRKIGIVETAAKEVGQITGKKCTTGDVLTTCTIDIDVGIINELKSNIHKRDIENQKDAPVIGEHATKDKANEAGTAVSDIGVPDCDENEQVIIDDEVFCIVPL